MIWNILYSHEMRYSIRLFHWCNHVSDSRCGDVLYCNKDEDSLSSVSATSNDTHRLNLKRFHSKNMSHFNQFCLRFALYTLYYMKHCALNTIHFTKHEFRSNGWILSRCPREQSDLSHKIHPQVSKLTIIGTISRLKRALTFKIFYDVKLSEISLSEIDTLNWIWNVISISKYIIKYALYAVYFNSSYSNVYSNSKRTHWHVFWRRKLSYDTIKVWNKMSLKQRARLVEFLIKKRSHYAVKNNGIDF